MLEKLLLNAKIVGSIAAGLAIAGTGTAAATVSLVSHSGAHVASATAGDPTDPTSTGVDPSASVDPTASADPTDTSSPDPTESDSPDPSESETPEPTDSVEPTPTDSSPAPSPSVSCPVPDGNHGDNVSATARDHSTQGREHGAAVSEMARSDCGREQGDDATAGDGSDDPADEDGTTATHGHDSATGHSRHGRTHDDGTTTGHRSGSASGHHSSGSHGHRGGSSHGSHHGGGSSHGHGGHHHG